MEFLHENIPKSKAQSKVRRRRITKACLSCRSRKVKCDCAKPVCTECRNRGIGECVYGYSRAGSHESPNDDVRAELERLYEENESLKRQLASRDGTLTGDADSDFSVDMTRFADLLSKANRLTYYGPLSFRALGKHHKEYLHNNFWGIRKFVNGNRKQWKLNARTYFSLVSIPDGTVDKEALVVHLQTFLPLFDTVLEIAESYFDGLWHHLFPIVERDLFLADFHKIFKKSIDGTVVIETDHSVADYSRITVTLAVIRFITKMRRNHRPEDLGTLFVDVDDALWIYMQRFLDCARHWTRTGVQTLQAILVYRLTKKVDPKDSDGGDSSNGTISFGLAMEMAVNLGLHANIDRLYEFESPKYREMLKHIWRTLLYFDVLNSNDVGHPLHVADEFCNFEYVNDGSLCFKTLILTKNVMKSINGTRLKYSDLVNCISRVRNFISGNFEPLYTTIQRMSSPTESVPEVLRNYLMQMQLIGLTAALYFMQVRLAKDKVTKRQTYSLFCRLTMLFFCSYIDMVAVYHARVGVQVQLKKEFICIVNAVLAQSMTRLMIESLMCSIMDVDDHNDEDGLFNPLLEDCPQVPQHELSLDLEKLQNIADTDPDDLTDSIGFDLQSRALIVIEIIKILFTLNMEEYKEFKLMDDLELVGRFSVIKYVFQRLTETEPMSSKANSLRKKVTVNYGSLLPQLPPFYQRSDPRAEEMLFKILNYQGEDLGVNNEFPFEIDQAFIEAFRSGSHI